MNSTRQINSHYCTRCAKLHPLHYVVQVDGKMHLCVECTRAYYFIPMVHGLNILRVTSRHALKLEMKAKQPELL